MDTVRDILADNPGGISRPGVLAWARLRIDPAFSDERLAHELDALRGEIVEEYGFLRWTGPVGPGLETGPATTAPTIGPEMPHPPPPGSPASPPGWPARLPADVGGAFDRADSTADPIEPGASIEATEPDDATARPSSPLLGIASRDWPAPPTEPSPSDAAPVPWSPVPTTAASTGPMAGRPAPTAGPIPGWQAPATTRRRGGLLARIGSALFVAAVVIANILGGSSGSSSSDGAAPTPGSTLGGVNVAADDLRVGDCIAVPAADFTELPRIPCGSPHEGEVFFIGPYVGDTSTYPADAGFERFVESTCHPAFEDYTGSRFDAQHQLDIGWFTPTADGWSSGDRVVQCYLAMTDGSRSQRSWRDGRP